MACLSQTAHGTNSCGLVVILDSSEADLGMGFGTQGIYLLETKSCGSEGEGVGLVRGEKSNHYMPNETLTTRQGAQECT